MNPSYNPPQPGMVQDETQGPVQPQHRGNWFTHLLPTVGSMAIPALGALLAPETGGLSLLASAGLAGAGSAGGKAVENATEGKGAFQGNDLAAGAEGFGGGLAGGLLGKVFNMGSGALAGRATNLTNASEQAAADAESQAASKGAINTAANTYKDINPTLQGNLGAKDALAHVTNMGYDIADPANLSQVANTSNDILNEHLGKALADAGPVDASSYNQIVKDAIAKESGTLGSYEPTALSRGRLGPANTPAAKLLAQLENAGAGVAKTEADPNEIRTLTSQLGSLAADAKPIPTAATGAIDPAQRSAYNVINNVRGQMKDLIYNRPGVNDALTALEGNLVPGEGMTPQLAEHLNGVITGAGRNGNLASQDLLDEISKNIDINKLGQEGQRVGQIVSSTGGQARAAMDAGLTPGATPTPGSGDTLNKIADGAGVLGMMTNHPAAMVLPALTNGAKMASKVAQSPAMLSTLSRVADLAAKLAPSAGAGVATAIPNMGADPANGAIMPGMNPGTNGMGTMPPQANPQQQFINDIRTLSVLNPDRYGTMGNSVIGMTPQLQHNQMLSNELSGIPSLFANAGGAQGMGGILSHISAMVPGTAANQYEQQRQATASQLAQSMGISPQAAMGLLMQIMNNPGTAGIQQGILGSMQGSLVH